MGGEVVNMEVALAGIHRSIAEMPAIISDQVLEKTRLLIQTEVRGAMEPVLIRVQALENALVILQNKPAEDKMPDGKRARSDDGGASSST
eukprot:10247023-Alexandrium_andersonii.AAC.1